MKLRGRADRNRDARQVLRAFTTTFAQVRQKSRLLVLPIVCVCAASEGCLARAEDVPVQVSAGNSPVTLSGYIDTSAHWNPGTGNANPAPYSFNAGKQDGFNLNVIDLDLERRPEQEEWSAGYEVELFIGPDSAFVNGTPFGPVRQAYVALQTPLGNGLVFQVGRWNDLTGYEETDKWKNPNYTHSYGWSIEPTEHTGIVAGYAFNECVSAKVGVANTWTTGPINQRALTGTTLATAQQDSGRETLVSLFNFVAPTNSPGFGGSSCFFSVNKGYGSVTRDETYISLGGTLSTPLPQLKLSADWDYSTHFGVNGVDTGPANSLALYLLGQLGQKLGLNLRGEYCHGDGLGALSEAYNGAPTPLHKVFALTGTLRYDVWKNVLTRLEVRWDHAADGTQSFGGTVLGMPTQKNELTVAAEWVFLF